MDRVVTELWFTQSGLEFCIVMMKAKFFVKRLKLQYLKMFVEVY